MWNNVVRAYAAKAVYEVWKNQGQPQTVAANAVLAFYRREIGDITPKVLGEVLAVMGDDPGPMPFLRVRVPNAGGEMGDLGLTDVSPERLLALAAEAHS
jgi:hypothetical protein